MHCTARFFICFFIALQINGLSAQVTREVQGNEQFIYKFKVEAVPSNTSSANTTLNTEPVIKAFLALPNISGCTFIENASCFKVHTQGELDITAVNEILVHFGYNPIVYNGTELPSGFPVYGDTGNSEKDNENHKNAKEQWIKDNPDKYRNLINQAKTSNALK